MTLSFEPPTNAGDRDLEQRVRAFLFDRGYGALRRVKVEASNGVVALRGNLPSFHMRQLAVECTKRVAGVRDLIDCIQIVSDIGFATEDQSPAGNCGIDEDGLPREDPPEPLLPFRDARLFSRRKSTITLH